MGQLEDLQAKGFGGDGGKQYTVENDITPLKKRVLVSDMHFGETKSKGDTCVHFTGPGAQTAKKKKRGATFE